MCNSLSYDPLNFKKTTDLIRIELIKWGENYIKNYPWRNTSDPYKITVAEIMLTRTKADQVKKLYIKFINKFPDFRSIVEAGPDKIKSELFSLGLSRRSDQLYRLAQEIIDKYNCVVPGSLDKLLKLPGMGNYTASAIHCSINNMPAPVLDTNTVRLTGRIFGLKVTDSSRRSRKFKDIMYELINCAEPRKFFYSILDFAKYICLEKNPKCNVCPLNIICCYYRERKYEKRIN